MLRAHGDAVTGVTALDFGSRDDQQLGVDFRYAVRCGNNDIVGSAVSVELPRCLEQLEELLNDGHLVSFGNDADHVACTSRLPSIADRTSAGPPASPACRGEACLPPESR